MFKCFLSEHLSYAVHGFFDIQLLDLPHEILTQVVSELDCTDFLALTLCCKNLFVRLSNEQIFLHFQRLNSRPEPLSVSAILLYGRLKVVLQQLRLAAD